MPKTDDKLLGKISAKLDCSPNFSFSCSFSSLFEITKRYLLYKYLVNVNLFLLLILRYLDNCCVIQVMKVATTQH